MWYVKHPPSKKKKVFDCLVEWTSSFRLAGVCACQTARVQGPLPAHSRHWGLHKSLRPTPPASFLQPSWCQGCGMWKTELTGGPCSPPLNSPWACIQTTCHTEREGGQGRGMRGVKRVEAKNKEFSGSIQRKYGFKRCKLKNNFKWSKPMENCRRTFSQTIPSTQRKNLPLLRIILSLWQMISEYYKYSVKRKEKEKQKWKKGENTPIRGKREFSKNSKQIVLMIKHWTINEHSKSTPKKHKHLVKIIMTYLFRCCCCAIFISSVQHQMFPGISFNFYEFHQFHFTSFSTLE